MVDLLIEHGTVVTMNDSRAIIEDGAVAIDGDTITAVGPTDELTEDYDADRVIDADGHAVLPGLIDAHAHVNDILIRGGVGTDRALHDWLLNVNKPTAAVMDAEDHATAAALYCLEAVRSGITTFVDNASGPEPGMWLREDIIDARLREYDRAGMRNVYAQEFIDRPVADTDDFAHFLESQQHKSSIEPTPTEPMDTDEALRGLESLIAEYHGTADGRQSVWPAPIYPWAVSPEGFLGSYELAEEHDVMTSTHASEIVHQERHHVSSVEYLNNMGYLGERTLLGHCVHVSERDIRLLAATDTKVSHNVLTNCALGSGIAPVPTMINYGVTVGIGTDNASASDTVNMINDMRFAAMVHKAHRRDASAMTAEKALEMATIDGAKTIGRADDLGSIDPGKSADIVLVDLEYPHMTPRPNVVSTIVYQAQGYEVDTVICDGSVIMEDGRVPGVEDAHPELLADARRAAEDVLHEAGLDDLRDRPWTSISDQ